MDFLSAVVAWSLRNRPVVLLGSLLLIFFGVRAAVRELVENQEQGTLTDYLERTYPGRWKLDVYP